MRTRMFRLAPLTLLYCLLPLLGAVSAQGQSVSSTIADPTTPGPYTPVNASYSDGTVQLGTDAENFPVRIAGDVWYPSGGSGPYPVIVFLHGQHEYCEFNDPTGLSGAGGEGGGTISAVLQTSGDELSTYDDGQCESDVPLGLATSTEIDSYAGYDYIGKELASDGYVVFSIDANDISSLSESADDASYIGRAQLVAKTLDFADALNLGQLPLNPLSMALEGRLDMTRIGLMGHSRGGQGINMFGVYDQTRPTSFADAEAMAVPQGKEDYGPRWPISALFSLAPVDGQGGDPRDYPTPVGMPYATLLPLCDGDVFDLEGDPPFERAKYLNSAAGYPTIEYAVNGADHDFFNTEWSDDDADPATGGIGFGTEDDACGNEQLPTRLSRTEERAVGATIIDAFMRYFVGGEHQFGPIVDGQAFPAAECPAARAAGIGISCDSVVQTSFIAPQSDRLDLVHPDSTTALPAQTLAGEPVTFTGFQSATACTPTAGEEDLTTSGCGSSPDRDSGPQLDLAWAGAATMTMSMGSSGTDVSGYSDVTLRAATDYLSALNVPGVEPDFDVILTDAAGQSATVDVDSHSSALVPSPGTTSRKVVLTGIDIPLSAFSGIDLAHVTSVTLSFGKEAASGEVQVSDIGFENMLAGASMTSPGATPTPTTAPGSGRSSTSTQSSGAPSTQPTSTVRGAPAKPPKTTTGGCRRPTRLSFIQHPAAPVREVKAIIEINGKPVRSITARRITLITIGRPKQSRFTLRLLVTLSDGEVISHRETYSGCQHGPVLTVVEHR